jgi:hypothetical protein
MTVIVIAGVENLQKNPRISPERRRSRIGVAREAKG